ncbi:MAG: NYN domain-containing protein [Desulfobaccales bacterium]
MHLLIDGYNLIRQSPVLRHLDARDLEAGREALLERLAFYRQCRPHHRLTVVFDGWQAGGPSETRDLHRGVRIIYSRRGERADEVIKRLLAQEGPRALVVSSDRELQEQARRVGAAWVSSREFDFLSSQAAGGAETEDDDDPGPRGPAKKGPARRLPKQERRRRQRLRKL